MYRNKIFLVAVMAATMLGLTSCFGPRKMVEKRIPVAINTVNSVGFKELNLTHGKDYEIVSTITSEATVIYSEQKRGEQVTIKEENGEFKIIFKYDSNFDEWRCTDFDGIARYGFLNNDYDQVFLTKNPEYVVRNLAIYRIINQAKVRGADGVVEPVISTNAEQRGKEIVFKTTVSAKLIKLKTDAK